MNKITLLITTHKPYIYPNEKMYSPIQVGKKYANLDLNILSDDSGNNISDQNKYFCELSGLYWAWKNDFFKTKYVGLVHYRRYFRGKEHKIATEQELLKYLKNVDCILPKKRHYFIETVYSHYKHAHYIADLDLTRTIISNKYPAYLNAFDYIMQQRSLHLYNMFIMEKSDFENYCQWLFSILFTLKEHIVPSNYDAYQQRVFGFIGERLFNVWVLHNNLKVKEIPIINIEGDNLVKKAISLLKRKFFK